MHIFEDRYRQLVADLLDGPEPRQFGVIAIRQGRETGPDGISSLYMTGCTAVVRQAEKLADGKYDLVTVGAQRFRLLELTAPTPYYSGDVEMLPDEDGDAEKATAQVPEVQRLFRSYLELLSEQGRAEIKVPELPDEPMVLSYLVAAATLSDLPVKQQLLEEPDSCRRLAAERSLLAAEIRMIRSLPMTPAPELRYAPYSQN
jgi:Lon protease-like protein